MSVLFLVIPKESYNTEPFILYNGKWLFEDMTEDEVVETMDEELEKHLFNEEGRKANYYSPEDLANIISDDLDHFKNTEVVALYFDY